MLIHPSVLVLHVPASCRRDLKQQEQAAAASTALIGRPRAAPRAILDSRRCNLRSLVAAALIRRPEGLALTRAGAARVWCNGMLTRKSNTIDAGLPGRLSSASPFSSVIFVSFADAAGVGKHSSECESFKKQPKKIASDSLAIDFLVSRAPFVPFVVLCEYTKSVRSSQSGVTWLKIHRRVWRHHVELRPLVWRGEYRKKKKQMKKECRIMA